MRPSFKAGKMGMELAWERRPSKTTIVMDSANVFNMLTKQVKHSHPLESSVPSDPRLHLVESKVVELLV